MRFSRVSLLRSVLLLVVTMLLFLGVWSSQPVPNAEAFRLYSFRWPTNQVTLDLSPIPDPAWRQALRQALEEWNQADVGVRFLVGPSPNKVYLGYDCRGNWLGVASLDSVNRQMVKGTIWVNTCYAWSTRSDPQTFDLRTMMLHEAGHVLGLDHSEHPHAIMHQGQAPGEQRRLHTDDIQGARALYQYQPQPPALSPAPTPTLTPAARQPRFRDALLQEAADLACRAHQPVCDLMRQAGEKGVVIQFGEVGDQWASTNDRRSITISSADRAELDVLAALLAHELRHLVQPPTTAGNWVDHETEAMEVELQTWAKLAAGQRTATGRWLDELLGYYRTGQLRQWVRSNQWYQEFYRNRR